VAADFGRGLPECGQLKGILGRLRQNCALAFRYVNNPLQPTAMYDVFPGSQGFPEKWTQRSSLPTFCGAAMRH
jgi:hypothetical protein